MSGFGQSIANEIRQLELAKGELDNVLSAALQVVAESFVAEASSPQTWPVYATAGARPPSLRKKATVPAYATTPVRRGVKHSIQRWAMQRIGAGWSVFNPAEYASYIHDNTSAGNLVQREIVPMLAVVEEESIGFVTGAVANLFAPAG